MVSLCSMLISHHSHTHRESTQQQHRNACQIQTQPSFPFRPQLNSNTTRLSKPPAISPCIRQQSNAKKAVNGASEPRSCWSTYICTQPVDQTQKGLGNWSWHGLGRFGVAVRGQKKTPKRERKCSCDENKSSSGSAVIMYLKGPMPSSSFLLTQMLKRPPSPNVSLDDSSSSTVP